MSLAAGLYTGMKSCFTRFHMGPSVEEILTFFFNRSNSLNKFAAMPIYGKTRLKIYFSRTKKALWLVVGILHR